MRAEKFWLTDAPGVRYAQKEAKSGFFSNETTVLRSSCLGGPSGVFEVARSTLPRSDSGANTPELARLRHNFGYLYAVGFYAVGEKHGETMK